MSFVSILLFVVAALAASRSSPPPGQVPASPTPAPLEGEVVDSRDLAADAPALFRRAIEALPVSRLQCSFYDYFPDGGPNRFAVPGERPQSHPALHRGGAAGCRQRMLLRQPVRLAGVACSPGGGGSWNSHEFVAMETPCSGCSG